MIRGTTPDLEFKLPFNTDVIESVWITFSQFNKELLTLDKASCAFKDDVITTRLTQEQTLLFTENAYVEIQLRVLTKDGTAIASNIMRSPNQRILKGGIIQ